METIIKINILTAMNLIVINYFLFGSNEICFNIIVVIIYIYICFYYYPL